MEKSYYTLNEVCEKTGITYEQLWYALITRKLQPTIEASRTRLFDDNGLQNVRDYLAKRKLVKA